MVGNHHSIIPSANAALSNICCCRISAFLNSYRHFLCAFLSNEIGYPASGTSSFSRTDIAVSYFLLHAVTIAKLQIISRNQPDLLHCYIRVTK